MTRRNCFQLFLLIYSTPKKIVFGSLGLRPRPLRFLEPCQYRCHARPPVYHILMGLCVCKSSCSSCKNVSWRLHLRVYGHFMFLFWQGVTGMAQDILYTAQLKTCCINRHIVPFLEIQAALEDTLSYKQKHMLNCNMLSSPVLCVCYHLLAKCSY